MQILKKNVYWLNVMHKLWELLCAADSKLNFLAYFGHEVN